MKYYFITFLFILFVPNISFAQFSNDCLGIWCTIDVDLTHIAAVFDEKLKDS